jgi:hypothetical protein
MASKIIETLRKEISSHAAEFKGQDPTIIKTQLESILKDVLKDKFSWKQLCETSTIAQVTAPRENPDPEALNRMLKGSVVNKSLDNELDSLAKDLSEGLENNKEGGKKNKFKIPFGPGDIAQVKQLMSENNKEGALAIIEQRVIAGATAAGWELSDLNTPQPNINFKNYSKRQVSINTTGVPFSKALSEIILHGCINEKELNAEGVKDATEESLGTAPEKTVTEAVSMVDGIVNGGPGTLEQGMEMTYNPD